jgi:hypothetical protein
MEGLVGTKFNARSTKKNRESVVRTYEKGNIFRTFGAFGISIKREFAKKDILLLASRFVGTSIADSFTVSRR